MTFTLRTLLILTATAGLAVGCTKKKKHEDSAETPTEQPPPPADGKALYKPANLPQNFAMVLPGALAIDTGNGAAALCLEGEGCEEAPTKSDPVAPTKDSSHGLSELRGQLDSLRSRIKDYTRQFSVVDTVISEHQAECDAGCTIKGATGKVTQEMVNLMVENYGGVEAFSDEELKGINEEVGQDFPLGDLVVQHPAADPNGFTTIVTITQDEGEDAYKLVLAFIKSGEDYPKVRVRETSSGLTAVEEGSSDPAPAPEAAALADEEPKKMESYSYDLQLDYDTVNQVFGVVENSVYAGSKSKNSFKFSADSSKAATHGATFSVVLDYSGDKGEGYSQNTTGFADDAGGYLQTIYSYDETEATVTLSDAAAEGKTYALFLGEVTLEKLNANPWDFWEVGNVDTKSSSYYGPMPAPNAADFKVFEVSYQASKSEEVPATDAKDAAPSEGGDEESKPVYTATTLTVASVTIKTNKVTSGYSEQVDASGRLVAYCYYDDVKDGKLGASSFCSSGYEDENAYSEAYASYAGEDGEIDLKGGVDASISGATMATLKGRDFLIVRKQDKLADLLPSLLAAYNGEDNGAYAQVIGSGYYYGDTEVNKDAKPDDVYEINFWNDAADAEGAHIVLIDYDAKFNTVLTPIAGAVTAVKVQ